MDALLVNSKAVGKSGLKTTAKARKNLAHAMDKTRSQSIEFGARRINQQNIHWWCLPGDPFILKMLETTHM
jgi:hypothetical protein